MIQETDTGLILIKNKNLEDFMLITQGHEYVTEGENVILKIQMIDKILNSSKLIITILFFL